MDKSEQILSQLDILQSYLDMANVPFCLNEFSENRKMANVSWDDQYSFFITEKTGKTGVDNIRKSCAITVYSGSSHEGISILYEEVENTDYHPNTIGGFEFFSTASKIAARYSKKNDTAIQLDRNLEVSQVQYEVGDEVPTKVCDERISFDLVVDEVNFSKPLEMPNGKKYQSSL